MTKEMWERFLRAVEEAATITPGSESLETDKMAAALTVTLKDEGLMIGPRLILYTVHEDGTTSMKPAFAG